MHTKTMIAALALTAGCSTKPIGFNPTASPSAEPVATSAPAPSSAAAPVKCEAGTHAQNGACVSDGCDDIGFEPNDDIAAARPIGTGNYAGLKLCTKDDRDFYVLDAGPAGGAVTVHVRTQGGGAVALYATDGSTSSDGYFTLVGAGANGGDEDWLTRVPVSGSAPIYMIAVGDGEQPSDYTLSVDIEPLDPHRDCLTDCGAMVHFDGALDPSTPEAVAAGYFVGTDQAYAFARRDMAMLLQSAYDAVLRKWPDTHPVYQSDICQQDGKTPGTDVGAPRHPTTTHVHGRDADIAYYQTGTDNDYRIICGDGSDTNGNGRAGRWNDGSFCTTDKNIVDMEREVYFMAQIVGSPLFRVLGVDQTLPKQIIAQEQKMTAAGELPGWAAFRLENLLGYGAAGGWQFHHHHTHLSLMDR